MQQIIRLYLDSLLLGLAVGIGVLAVLVTLDFAALRESVLAAGNGAFVGASVVLFCAGVFSSVRFAVEVVLLELEEDRAIAWRKRHGWGRSPRDRLPDNHTPRQSAARNREE